MIGALAQVASTWLQSRTAKENTDKTIQANKDLAEYQFSKNLEAWKLQNEYNTPSAQMQRFADAGLNKNLIYGQGTPGNAQTIPQYQAPKVEYNYRPPVDPLAVLGAYQDFRMKQAQTKAMEAEATSAPTYFQERAKSMKYREDSDFFDSMMKRIDLEWKSGDYGQDWKDTPTGHKLLQWGGDFGSGVQPTEYQKSQLDYNTARARNEAEKLNYIKAQNEKFSQSTKLMQLEIDNFLTKMWSGILTQGANTILRFR